MGLSPLAFGAPGAIVANIAHATPEVVAPAVATYAGIAAPAPVAVAAAAAPSREAVLTTIKLNPPRRVLPCRLKRTQSYSDLPIHPASQTVLPDLYLTQFPSPPFLAALHTFFCRAASVSPV